MPCFSTDVGLEIIIRCSQTLQVNACALGEGNQREKQEDDSDLALLICTRLVSLVIEEMPIQKFPLASLREENIFSVTVMNCQVRHSVAILTYQVPLFCLFNYKTELLKTVATVRRGGNPLSDQIHGSA